MDTTKIIEFAEKAENYGQLEDYVASGIAVEPDCQDELEIRINTKRDLVTEISYMITESACTPAKACASLATMLAKNKPVLEAYLIDADRISNEFGGLTKENYHCAQMAELALKRAILDYSRFKKNQQTD
ncbi:MAG: iron-sulfur cluster assembly scaffold protein [Eubacteriaceae bacterium]|jgi:NifU-like protein involved in Fe-S cluster formation|nr:iron-sulfur cluster assembly scaffold protein [Eubacteriaceae bacterium]